MESKLLSAPILGVNWKCAALFEINEITENVLFTVLAKQKVSHIYAKQPQNGTFPQILLI